MTSENILGKTEEKGNLTPEFNILNEECEWRLNVMIFNIDNILNFSASFNLSAQENYQRIRKYADGNE